MESTRVRMFENPLDREATSQYFGLPFWVRTTQEHNQNHNQKHNQKGKPPFWKGSPKRPGGPTLKKTHPTVDFPQATTAAPSSSLGSRQRCSSHSSTAWISEIPRSNRFGWPQGTKKMWPKGAGRFQGSEKKITMVCGSK